MHRLVSTAEAAEILGLSLQGVHYRIKKNQLRSKKDNGKTYVYIDEGLKKNKDYKDKARDNISDIPKIIELKNEQIELLKESNSWIKKQYESEIFRLEENQKKMLEVFDREIKLLQAAFNEMRGVYKKNELRIEEKKEKYLSFISIGDFYMLMKNHRKSDNEIKFIILDRVKKNDARFIFNKNTKDVIIQNGDFLDLL